MGRYSTSLRTSTPIQHRVHVQNLAQSWRAIGVFPRGRLVFCITGNAALYLKEKQCVTRVWKGKFAGLIQCRSSEKYTSTRAECQESLVMQPTSTGAWDILQVFQSHESDGAPLTHLRILPGPRRMSSRWDEGSGKLQV